VIKAVIFDNFGVIYPQAMGKFFDEHYELFKSSPEVLDRLNYQIDLGEITRKEFFEGLSKVSGIPALQLLKAIDRQMIQDSNLVEIIKKLKSKYKIGLISNAGKEEIAVMYRDGLDKLFDTMVVSYEVGVTKPSPAIYRECTKRLSVEPDECLFVDDSQTNLDGAQKVGMEVLPYPEFGKIPDELEKLIKES
jgi:HAD superfamily hydrolase (TIGR01509 family)